MNNEPAMIFGKACVLTEAEKDFALERITTKLIPGLWVYGRSITKRESAATIIADLDRVSAKARTGEPTDDDEDIFLLLWACLLPLPTTLGAPITGGNTARIAVPE